MAASHPEPNLAATLPTPQANPYVVQTLPVPEPGPDELLVRVHAVAINPADAVIQDSGVIFPADAYPVVSGYDLAGVVVKVGGGDSDDAAAAAADAPFRPGDRVCACLEYGAFQTYAIARKAVTARIPAAMSFAEGSVLPVGICTAAAGLFVPGSMELRSPGGEEKGQGEVVLVWGGASAVGSAAVQMLVAAGYRVAATANEQNAGYLKELGAEWAFDYKKEGVEAEVQEALSGINFAGAFSAVIGDEPLGMCARIVAALGKDEKSRVVGTARPPFMPFEGQIPEGIRFGYCVLTSVMPDSHVAKMMNFPQGSAESLELGAKLWKWLSRALEDGSVKAKPEPRIVGRGVEKIQNGVDAWRKGVSAQKIVVEIP